jgi:hypothetical protein
MTLYIKRIPQSKVIMIRTHTIICVILQVISIRPLYFAASCDDSIFHARPFSLRAHFSTAGTWTSTRYECQSTHLGSKLNMELSPPSILASLHNLDKFVSSKLHKDEQPKANMVRNVLE